MSLLSLPLKSSIGIVAVAIPIVLYINRLKSTHGRLSKTIKHYSEVGENDILERINQEVASLPHNVVQAESHHVVLYDDASKTISTSLLPPWNEQQLLTEYLRHNMCKFANMPQAWILWLMEDPVGKKTFEPELISELEFSEGDRVCGGYIVKHRQSDRVDMGLSMGQPGSENFVEGRLIIGIRLDRSKDATTFRTQTLMWRRKDSNMVMPLERSVPKWLHELASWGLIDQGVAHLRQLRENKFA